MSAFEIVPPSSVRAPLVAHLPHASTAIPVDVRAELLVSDDELALELARLTDWYTDELFAGLADVGATLFVNRRSRLVFDPERFLDDADESAASLGQGVVYTHGTQGQPLREPDAELRTRRVEELYRPYHAALDGVIEELVTTFGTCTLVDCHSFPTLPLPTEVDSSPGRPDICIGTDEAHTPPELAARLERAFAEAGYDVRRDSPYTGTFVPSGYYRTDRRVRSVMIEARRGLYMDEETLQRDTAFLRLQDVIRGAVADAMGVAIPD